MRCIRVGAATDAFWAVGLLEGVTDGTTATGPAVMTGAAAGAFGCSAMRAAATTGFAAGASAVSFGDRVAPKMAPTSAALARLAMTHVRRRFETNGGFSMSGSGTSTAVGLVVEGGPSSRLGPVTLPRSVGCAGGAMLGSSNSSVPCDDSESSEAHRSAEMRARLGAKG